MSHSPYYTPSQHYYQERLGLDPSDDLDVTRDGHTTGADFKTFGGYEESLSKFKGIVYSLNIYQLIGTCRDAAAAVLLLCCCCVVAVCPTGIWHDASPAVVYPSCSLHPCSVHLL